MKELGYDKFGNREVPEPRVYTKKEAEEELDRRLKRWEGTLTPIERRALPEGMYRPHHVRRMLAELVLARREPDPTRFTEVQTFVRGQVPR